MNKFAVGLVLSGALTAVTSPVWMPMYNGMEVSEAATANASEGLSEYICELPDGGRFHMTEAECDRAKTPGTAEYISRQNELAAIEKQNAAIDAEKERLGEWAAHQAEVQQAHEDKCWDQMEARGYGDPNCY